MFFGFGRLIVRDQLPARVYSQNRIGKSVFNW